MVHIALDAMGGDRGSDDIVSGALQAVAEADLNVSLFGDEKKLAAILKGSGGSNSDRINVVHTTEVVGMGESPIEAIRNKPDSSIMVAFKRLKAGEVDAVVSAGNSGATMAAAVRSLGRLKSIARPGIASIFPTLKKPVVMMDVGANVDCRPKHLFQFGLMASAFSEVVIGKKRPRVGLLSIGEEQGKGNTLVRKTDELFRNSSLNYIGNIEGSDTFKGDVDVIVCDGFVGNVALKVIEGVAEAVSRHVKHELEDPEINIGDAVLCQNLIDRFKRKLDYEEYGGAPLLGIKGVGIVCHGGSSSKAIKNAIRVAAQYVNNRIVEKMSLELETFTAG
jgi:glycerol-3-phosphate acyltransferase PlsX